MFGKWKKKRNWKLDLVKIVLTFNTELMMPPLIEVFDFFFSIKNTVNFVICLLSRIIVILQSNNCNSLVVGVRGDHDERLVFCPFYISYCVEMLCFIREWSTHHCTIYTLRTKLQASILSKIQLPYRKLFSRKLDGKSTLRVYR